MADRITANLPSRDFDSTAAFYGRLGFEVGFRDDGWMILGRGDQQVEFFHHPELDPKTSWFSACIRVDDPQGLLTQWQKLGISVDQGQIPRLTGFFKPGNAPRMFALVDEDGSLLRVMGNGDEPDV
jgi:hypothetical protein